jgi:hypothetical protein
MSVIETQMGGRRAAARDSAEKRKKLILAGLVALLVAVLVFELPKLMNRSSSSSSTASTAVATTATPAVTLGGTPLTVTAAKRLRLIHRMDAKDPFVPLIHASTSTSTSTSSSSSTPASTPAPAQPSFHFTPSATASAAPAVTRPGVTKPVHVKPAAPTAAVMWTNGQRQVIGLGQTFKIGQVQFRLVAVTRKLVRLKIVGGAFANGKPTITARKGHRVKLTNTATGIEYGFRFTAGTNGAPTTTAGNS